MVVSETGGIGTKVIKTDWPFEEGLNLGNQKLREDSELEPEIDLTTREDNEGL